ncbi:FliH/SctL family protein [Limnoglobus roseus]|uniref:FliH/SctL family protein n=1 Tax=Limnoglobus roseus TaxID=2598579 RepID=UPI00143DA0C3|nr:FliH/SctL family protein [Limnoglobus roseus]
MAPATPVIPIPQIPQNLSDTAIGRDMAADRKMIQTTLATIQAKVAELSRQQAANLDGLQNAAVELALTIAVQLLHREVSADEFPVEAMVRDMAAELVNDTPVTVWLNPDDLKLLERRLGGQRLLSGDDPKLVADDSLQRCECRVEGGNGSLVLSDPTRHLQEIRDDLLRNLADARTARTA